MLIQLLLASQEEAGEPVLTQLGMQDHGVGGIAPGDGAYALGVPVQLRIRLVAYTYVTASSCVNNGRRLASAASGIHTHGGSDPCGAAPSICCNDHPGIPNIRGPVCALFLESDLNGAASQWPPSAPMAAP